MKSTMYVMTMLEIYLYAEPKQPDSPTAQKAVDTLIDTELLDSRKEVTAKGLAWISMILNTPFPKEVNTFVHPETNEVIKYD